MEDRMGRGVSFHVLPSNSSGDENYSNTSLREMNAEAGKANKSQRRRRRSKMRKRIISDSLCDEMPSYSNSRQIFSLGADSHNSFCESGHKQVIDESNSCQPVGSFIEEPIQSSSISEAQGIILRSKSGSRVLSSTESSCFNALMIPDSVSDGPGPETNTPSKSLTDDKPCTISLERSSLDTVPDSATNHSPQIALNLGRNSTIHSVSSLDARSMPANLHQNTPSRTLELRQRYVNCNGQESCNDSGLLADEDIAESSGPMPSNEQNQDSFSTKLGLRILFPSFPERPSETSEVLDWERLMSDSSAGVLSIELSPWQYIVKELTAGSSLRSTTSDGDEKKRHHVYNTMFHVPWRCELLIDIGFFLCLDSFLSLFTIMPARMLMFLGKRIVSWRQFHRPFADELSDFWCLLVMVLGVTLLQQADISYIYHSIRFQSSIKLYVVYNVLEIFDKLCQSFGGDVLQVLFNSAMAVSSCSSERLFLESLRFLLDQTIAILCFMLHCLIILSQAITVSAAINPTNNALMMLLISNNFAEIKSNVFKRVTKDNLHKVAYHDVVERFHIMTCLCFVFAQHVMVAEGNWVKRFMFNAVMVLACEVLIDIIKHSFLAKFNDIKPVAYSDFLQALCKQILHIPSHEEQKRLIFVPIAPACVVIRVLIPLYAAYISRSSIWWRLLTTITLGMGTYAMLCVCKVVVGIGLQMHARWYLERCQRNKRHFHAD